MNDADDRERAFVARGSLVLFITGLLVPFIIAVFALGLPDPKLAHEDARNAAAALAFGFSLTAELLALILGIVGRPHLSGKIGMYGAVVTFLIPLALVFLLWKH
jgi:hypothetical protein